MSEVAVSHRHPDTRTTPTLICLIAPRQGTNACRFEHPPRRSPFFFFLCKSSRGLSKTHAVWLNLLRTFFSPPVACVCHFCTWYLDRILRRYSFFPAHLSRHHQRVPQVSETGGEGRKGPKTLLDFSYLLHGVCTWSDDLGRLVHRKRLGRGHSHSPFLEVCC